MDNQQQTKALDPLTTLIIMLNNELQSLRQCLKQGSGYEPIVQSLLRILRSPQTANPNPDYTLGEWVASIGLSKAFASMYGDAYMHINYWERSLREKQARVSDPTGPAGAIVKINQAMLTEFYLIQILRFLEERQEELTKEKTGG